MYRSALIWFVDGTLYEVRRGLEITGDEDLSIRRDLNPI